MSLLLKLRCLLPARRRAIQAEMREELDSLASLFEAEGESLGRGSLMLAAEDSRAAWTWTWLEQMASDLRYAFRTMRRNPGLTLTAVSSLAVGIGANTAIFSLAHSILFKPLPAHDPASLVVLTSHSKGGRVGDFGYGDYTAIRGASGAFSGVLAASTVSTITAGGDAEAAPVQRKIVSANYFSMLGIPPALGRVFREDEEDQPVVLIGDGWWRRAFGSAADVAGRQIDLDGKAFTIAGVAPPWFLSETAGEKVDVWTTMALMPPALRAAPGYTWLNLMARRKPGVTAAEAAAALSGVSAQLTNRFIERIEVEPGAAGSSGLRDGLSAPLRVLMGIVAAALLMACANLAGLLLARAASRQREIAARLAIGASRARLLRQLLTESIVLAAVGGLLGLGLSFEGQRALLWLAAGAGKTISVDLRPDAAVLLFTTAVSVASGLLFGLAPALHALRQSVAGSLRTRSGVGLRGGLVAVQVALSMLLLVVGGLFAHTLRNLKQQDLGIRADHVLSAQLGARGQGRPAGAELATELLRRVEAIPGVRSACASFEGALGNSAGIRGFRVDAVEPPGGGESRAGANWVSPRCFETLGLPLIEGREFTAADSERSTPVAIVNRAFAVRYAAADRAAGRRLLFNGKSYEIVGVAKDAKRGDLRAAAQPAVYFAALQTGAEIHSLEVRTAGSPIAVAADLRRAVREADPRLRVASAAALEQLVDEKLARERLIADLAGFFAALTLMLVVVGVYGTVAFSAARRTKEIGIRMALGARPAHIARVVMGRLAAEILAGVAAGAALAVGAGRLLSFLLFGLTATDLPTIGSAGVLLVAAALIAAYLPIRRAWRLDPTSALRLD